LGASLECLRGDAGAGFAGLQKWSPAEGNNFLQFLDRIDGRGGFAVVETEDPTLIARDTAIFGAFLDFSVYPVLDSEEWAGIAVEAVEFRRSAS
jgi:hypothetical protein